MAAQNINHSIDGVFRFMPSRFWRINTVRYACRVRQREKEKKGDQICEAWSANANKKLNGKRA